MPASLPGATPPRTPRLDGLVADGTLPGFSVAVRTADGSTTVRTRGVTAPEGDRPVEPSTSYRLASVSKPVAALLAGILTSEGVLRPDDEICRWVPELDGVRVLRRPDGPLDDTVPAERPITVRDPLTFRSGHGVVPAAVTG